MVAARSRAARALFDRGTDTFGQDFHDRCWLSTSNQEFVAAESPEQVVAVQLFAYQSRQQPQRGISRGVAMAIVDLLEVVQVEYHQRHRFAIGLR